MSCPLFSTIGTDVSWQKTEQELLAEIEIGLKRIERFNLYEAATFAVLIKRGCSPAWAHDLIHDTHMSTAFDLGYTPELIAELLIFVHSDGSQWPDY